MDITPSCGRDDPIVTKPSQGESPVFRLPTELTILIFQQCESDIRPRLTLTHVCQRWSRIAISDTSLWTNIHIDSCRRNPNARLDHILSILGMQVDRTANQLLDVTWRHSLGGKRSEYLSPADGLTTLPGPPSTRLRTWNSYSFGRGQLASLGTITSRLKALKVTWSSVSPAVIVGHFAKSLTHISSLRVYSIYFHKYTPFLPANIVNLRLDDGNRHHFPHVQKYELKECTFTGTNSVDLRSMTILIVTGALTIHSNYHVLLPALQELKLGTLTMSSGAKIEAPALDILYFMNCDAPGDDADVELLTHTERSLLDPGYLLSPNTSIIADSYLPTTALIMLLARSPKATHATLQFDDWADALVVLERLVGLTTETDSRAAGDGNLCPSLSELRLDFGWEFAESSASKEWLLNGLQARREAGIARPLSIYASWKGEGRYVHLTRS